MLGICMRSIWVSSSSSWYSSLSSKTKYILQTHQNKVIRYVLNSYRDPFIYVHRMVTCRIYRVEQIKLVHMKKINLLALRLYILNVGLLLILHPCLLTSENFCPCIFALINPCLHRLFTFSMLIMRVKKSRLSQLSWYSPQDSETNIFYQI